jgi:arginase
LQRAGLQPTLLWLDAHGDFNTWETTPSGFLGGMPLAMLVGRGEQTLVNAVRLHPLSEMHVILTDGRDLDPGEKLAIEDSEVVHIRDMRALPEHPLLSNPLYVHFDTDIINPNDAPAMRYATPGGPTAAELKALFGALALTGKVAAVSMTTWTPDLDSDGRSRAVCMELLESLIQ